MSVRIYKDPFLKHLQIILLKLLFATTIAFGEERKNIYLDSFIQVREEVIDYHKYFLDIHLQSVVLPDSFDNISRALRMEIPLDQI